MMMDVPASSDVMIIGGNSHPELVNLIANSTVEDEEIEVRISKCVCFLAASVLRMEAALFTTRQTGRLWLRLEILSGGKIFTSYKQEPSKPRN
uniref:(California timema) hypothetical protein n=1 Tax=Timema californicum TaxID=61474 RepID=A0A7R9IZW1_TIMCA|nr:unnamed protein product [Timema californicum]